MSDKSGGNDDVVKKSKQLNDKSIDFAETGDYPKAIECASEAIKLHPAKLYYKRRSLYYLRTRQFDLALKDANVWVGDNPTEVPHFIRLGACLIGLKRCEEADEMFRKAIKKSPRDKSAILVYRNQWFQVARASRSLSNKHKENSCAGKQDNKTGAGTAVTESEQWHNKGIDFADRDDYLKGIECASEAIKLHPAKLYYKHRSLYYLRTHQFDLALKDANIWVDNNPTEVPHFKRLGACLMGLERYEEADELYRKAIEKSPRDKMLIWGFRNKWLEIAHERALKSKESEKTVAREERGFVATIWDFVFGSSNSSPAEPKKDGCEKTSSDNDVLFDQCEIISSDDDLLSDLPQTSLTRRRVREMNGD